MEVAAPVILTFYITLPRKNFIALKSMNVKL